MAQALSKKRLTQENRSFSSTGGVSAGNRSHGFVPAFFDTATGILYLSRFPDGSLASVHCLEGLPDELMVMGVNDGSVGAVKETVIAGFLRDGCFYTREQAAKTVHAANSTYH